MTGEPEPQDLVGRSADERLLDAGPESLPSSIGRPVALPAPSGSSLLVVSGVALGAVTLIGGIALAILGVAGLISGSGFSAAAELCAGILLAATHWGWIHVAAWANDRLEAREDQDLVGDRQRWLASIEPYVRYEVATRVGQDGSITIETICHRPELSGPHTFTFTPHQVLVEVHSAEEPAAAIAERAEVLRSQAAAQTARACELYEAAAGAYRAAQLKGQDEQEQLAAARAASQALSEQINTKLREPTLAEEAA